MSQTKITAPQAFMGAGCLCVIVAALLMFFGPRDSAGHLLWWWYVVVFAGTGLFAIGQKLMRLRRGGTGPTSVMSIKDAEATLVAAESNGNKHAQAKANFDLGVAYQASYQLPPSKQTPDFTPLNEALGPLTQAVELYRELGDRDKEGLALSNLGIIWYAKGKDTAALRHFSAAVAIARRLEFPDWEYHTIQRLSKLLGEMGRFAEGEALVREYSLRRASRK